MSTFIDYLWSLLAFIGGGFILMIVAQELIEAVAEYKERIRDRIDRSREEDI